MLCVCVSLCALCQHVCVSSQECKQSVAFTFCVCVCWNDWSLRLKKKQNKKNSTKKCKGIGAEQQENDDAIVLRQQKQNDLLKIHRRDLNISINRWRSEPKWKKKVQVKEIVFDSHKGLIVFCVFYPKRVFYRCSQLGKRRVWSHNALLTWVTLIYIRRLKGANGTAMWAVPCMSSFRGGIWQCFIVKAAEQFPC